MSTTIAHHRLHLLLRGLLLLLVAAVGLVSVEGSLLARGADVTAATPEQKKAASQAYQKGKQAMDAGKLEEALAGFRESYDTVASPNSHFMVVRAMLALGRGADAYREVDLVIAEAEQAAKTAPKYLTTAKAATKKKAEIESQIALLALEVTAPDGATLTVAGRNVDRADWAKPIAVDPGPVQVELQTDAGVERREVRAVAGAPLSVAIAPATPAPAASPAASVEPPDGEQPVAQQGGGPDWRLYSYIAGGVGAAGLITFAVFGGLTLSEYSSLDDRCGPGACPASQSSDADAGRTYQTVANVGLIVGAVGVAAAAGLFVYSVVQEPSDAGEGPVATSLKVGVGPGALQLSGTF